MKHDLQLPGNSALQHKFISRASKLLLLFFLPLMLHAQLTDFLYKDVIRIQENSNTQKINYQVLLTINTQTLIAQGRMSAAGDDIRFAKDCAGATLYNYYIESGINTTATKIWVLIDTLPANGTRLVTMFYGNNAVAAASSFDNTFPPASRLQVPAGTVALTGTNNYSWFEVEAGATVTVSPGTPLVINARKIIVTGTIDASGSGYLGGASASNGSGPGHGFVSTGNSGTYGGGGAGYGAAGGDGGGPNTTTYSQTGAPGTAYGTTATDSIDMGSGGGGAATAGGNGGGAITLNGDDVSITGVVRADGSAGVQTILNGGGGGGAGGGIRIKGNWVTVSGTLSAIGGTGGGGAYSGGGGSGGRIKIFSDAAITNTSTENVAAGNPGTQNSTGILPGLPGNAGETSQGNYTSNIPTYSTLSHVSLSASATTVCAGTPVLFSASPTSPFSNFDFQKNSGSAFSSVQSSALPGYGTSSIASNDKFRVVATYNGSACVDTSNVITMTVNPAPVVDLGPDTMICTAQTISLDPGTFANYTWQDNSTNQTYTVSGSSLGSGTYVFSVAVMDGNGCVGSDSVTVTVTVCTGVAENNANAISVLPNPAHDVVTVLSANPVSVEMLDLRGRVVIPLTHENANAAIDLSALPDGIYYLRISDGENISVQKIVVEK